MALLVEHKGDYGFQCAYANFSATVVASLAGFLIDHFSAVSGVENYRWAKGVVGFY